MPAGERSAGSILEIISFWQNRNTELIITMIVIIIFLIEQEDNEANRSGSFQNNICCF